MKSMKSWNLLELFLHHLFFHQRGRVAEMLCANVLEQELFLCGAFKEASTSNIYMLAVKKVAFTGYVVVKIRPGRWTISKHGCPGRDCGVGPRFKDYSLAAHS